MNSVTRDVRKKYALAIDDSNWEDTDTDEDGDYHTAVVILDIGGVLIPEGGGNPDPSLEWKSSSMFDGDHFLWSPSHGQFIEDLSDLEVEVYICSGLGQSGCLILQRLYEFPLLGLSTWSEEELEVGDGVLQRKDLAVWGLRMAHECPVIWVDDKATLESDPEDDFFVIRPDPQVGLTKEQMNLIVALIPDYDE